MAGVPVLKRHSWLLWMVVASAVAIMAYWPGLSGPFIFDDQQNMRFLQAWRSGEISFWDLVAGNGNLLFHRSLAMASLALNSMVGGEDSFSFKAGNLLLHVVCGWVSYLLFSKLLLRDKNLGVHAVGIALCMSVIWLVHPLNVSTVLYVIQRMTQIATLFPLIGVWLYVSIRDRMLRGEISEIKALGALLFAVGACTALGIQGKQSALILPGLCLVVELGWYQRAREWSRAVRVFYGLSIALPAVVIVAVIIMKWSWLHGNMLEWGMTPVERLMSQSRVLWTYVQGLLLPYSPSMGIYTDDFQVSRAWLSPWTTLPALIGLLLVSVLVWRARTSRPAAFVGWFWFLVAHSIEASIVPIELYYEHRNYLPAFGLMLMALDLLMLVAAWLVQRNVMLQKYAYVFLVCTVLGLCVQTRTMALQWRSLYGIALSGIQAHPDSARAYVDYGRASIQAGLPNDAYDAFKTMAANSNPAIATIGAVEVTMLNCHFLKNSDPAELLAAAERSSPRINYVLQYAIGDLVGVRERDGCGDLTAQVLAQVIERILQNAAAQPEMSQSKWSLRYNAATVHYQAGNMQRALGQARIAWKQTPDPAIALLYVRLLLNNDEHAAAVDAFWEVMARAKYSRVEQIYTGTRGAALRAMLEEIDRYAQQHELPLLNSVE